MMSGGRAEHEPGPGRGRCSAVVRRIAHHGEAAGGCRVGERSGCRECPGPRAVRVGGTGGGKFMAGPFGRMGRVASRPWQPTASQNVPDTTAQIPAASLSPVRLGSADLPGPARTRFLSQGCHLKCNERVLLWAQRGAGQPRNRPRYSCGRGRHAVRRCTRGGSLLPDVHVGGRIVPHPGPHPEVVPVRELDVPLPGVRLGGPGAGSCDPGTRCAARPPRPGRCRGTWPARPPGRRFGWTRSCRRRGTSFPATAFRPAPGRTRCPPGRRPSGRGWPGPGRGRTPTRRPPPPPGRPPRPPPTAGAAGAPGLRRRTHAVTRHAPATAAAAPTAPIARGGPRAGSLSGHVGWSSRTHPAVATTVVTRPACRSRPRPRGGSPSPARPGLQGRRFRAR